MKKSTCSHPIIYGVHNQIKQNCRELFSKKDFIKIFFHENKVKIIMFYWTNEELQILKEEYTNKSSIPSIISKQGKEPRCSQSSYPFKVIDRMCRLICLATQSWSGFFFLIYHDFLSHFYRWKHFCLQHARCTFRTCIISGELQEGPRKGMRNFNVS